MIEKYCRTDFKNYEDFYQNFTINVPEQFNFGFDIVDGWAKKDPKKVAMVWCDDKGEERTFTFKEISDYSNQAANYFLSLGIGKGDAVMLILKRRYEFWFSIVALHKIGAIAIPATHLLTEKDIIYRVNAADIKMIISVDEEPLVSSIRDAAHDAPALQIKMLLGRGNGEFKGFDGCYTQSEKLAKNSEIQNEDPMLIYFTSGTTGMPKMVLHDFAYPLGHIITAKFWQNLDENSLHATVADTGWAKASWGKIYGQWISGAAIFVYDMDKFVPLNLLEMVCKHKVTSFCAPPTVYRFLIKEDLSQFDFSHMRYATTAGEPLNAEVFNRFRQITGLEIKEGFGQSETVALIATFPWLKPVPGSLGRFSPYYGVTLLNDEGEPCDVGDEGEICINTKNGGPAGLFKCYYRDEERTRSLWYGGYYHTGDMAWMDEDGFVYFIGRADDVIKSSGYRIGPFEVESALIEHPAVLECAISAVPDAVRGQVVKATVVLARGYFACDVLKVELQEHVKRVTAPYKYPRIIEFVDELPKTISGKIKRAELRRKDQE
jgi:acetyl-CoA synthetase